MTAQEAPRTLEAVPAGPAPDSPLGRLRAAHTRRQQAASLDLDLPGMPGLVARAGVISDPGAAMGAMRVAMAFAGAADISPDEVVDEALAVIAAGVMSLHVKTPDGLEPITDEAGRPVRFDAFYGAAIGTPEITTATGAVVSAFTTGEPPVLDATAVLAFAVQVARFNDEAGQPDPGPLALTS